MKSAAMPLAVPPSFLCPISLEVMKDPVTLSTGHTYDRPNIEKWLRAGHHTCPVTMTPLQDETLIPNLIVRRLIQAWVADNECKRALNGENMAPSCFSVRDCVVSLVSEIAKGHRVPAALSALRQIAKESKENRSYIVSSGAPPLLVSLLRPEVGHGCGPCEDALSILALLCRSSWETRSLVTEQQKLPWIVWHLRCGGNVNGRLAAATLVGALVKREDAAEAVSRAKGVVEGLVSLLTGEEGMRYRAEKPVVKALRGVCRMSRENRVKAIEEGAVGALVHVIDRCQRASTEKALATLELLCDTAEGKDAASKLPTFFPALVNRILRVSPASTEHAAACILHVCSLNRAENLQSAIAAGIYPRLLLVLQSNGTSQAKWKAREVLKRLHHVFGFMDAQLIHT